MVSENYSERRWGVEFFENGCLKEQCLKYILKNIKI